MELKSTDTMQRLSSQEIKGESQMEQKEQKYSFNQAITLIDSHPHFNEERNKVQEAVLRLL